MRFIYIWSEATFTLWQQSWVANTEIIWPPNPKIFTLFLYRECLPTQTKSSRKMTPLCLKKGLSESSVGEKAGISKMHTKLDCSRLETWICSFNTLATTTKCFWPSLNYSPIFLSPSFVILKLKVTMDILWVRDKILPVDCSQWYL